MPRAPAQVPRVIEETAAVPFQAFKMRFTLIGVKVAERCAEYECMCLLAGGVGSFRKIIPPVRIHSGCITGEVFDSGACDCAWQLKHSLSLMNAVGRGLLIYLPFQEGRGHGIFEKIRSFRHVETGMTSMDAFATLGLNPDIRNYELSLALLSHFGVRRLRLITNNPAKLAAVKEGGFDIVGRIPSIMPVANSRIRRSLRSKASQSGHLI